MLDFGSILSSFGAKWSIRDSSRRTLMPCCFFSARANKSLQAYYLPTTGHYIPNSKSVHEELFFIIYYTQQQLLSGRHKLIHAQGNSFFWRFITISLCGAVKKRTLMHSVLTESKIIAAGQLKLWVRERRTKLEDPTRTLYIYIFECTFYITRNYRHYSLIQCRSISIVRAWKERALTGGERKREMCSCILHFHYR